MHLEDMKEENEIFQCAPISIWEEDFSEVKSCFDDLRRKGVKGLRKYFEKYPEEVLSFANKIKIVNVSNSTLQLYQAESPEAFYRGLTTIFSKESYDVFKEELIALSEGKTEFSSEAVNLTLRGEERHILLKVAVAPGSENTLSKVFVFIIDISDRKHLEKELNGSEEKYRKIFETANDAIFVADIEKGIIFEANKRAEQLLSMPCDEIVGMHFTQLHPKDETSIYKEIFRNHVRRRKHVSENLVVCNKAGDRIPVTVSSSVMQLHGKKYISAIFRKVEQKDYTRRNLIENQNYSSDIPIFNDMMKLTKREREILVLIAEGLTSKRISNQLFISKKTVDTHRTRIMRKLDVHNTADIVRYAVSSGLLDKTH